MKKENSLDFSKKCMKSYGKYSLEQRAIPATPDGLKPVHRRVLWSAYKLGLASNKPTTKCARVVGDTIAKYHPHGDCLCGNTQVPLLSGKVVKLKNLIGKKPKWILAFDEKTGKYVPALAHSFRVGQTTREMYKIHLSNGEVIRCTSNHQFLTNQENWVKAEDLQIGTMLKAGDIYIEKGKYTKIKVNDTSDKEPLHLYLYKHKLENATQILHHVNEIKNDNRPKNLKVLGRPEHALLHASEEQLSSLERGRIAQGATKKARMGRYLKNSSLMRTYNQTLALRKAINVVNIILNKNIELTEENYLKHGKTVYNLTKLSTIKRKYGYNLKQLAEIAPTWKMDTTDSKGLSGVIPQERKRKNKSRENQDNSNMFKAIRAVLNLISVEKLTWKSYLKKGRALTEFNKTKVLFLDKKRLQNYFKIKSIQDIRENIPLSYGCTIDKIEKVFLKEDKIFYDFTVDGYENMIIKVGNGFVVAHNSGVYQGLVTMITSFQNPLLHAQGNFGNKITGDGPASYRYTETRLTEFAERYLLDPQYLAVTPMVPNYDGKDMEPVYLPAKLPLCLVHNIEGIATGASVVIPSFTVHSLTKVVLLALKKGKVSSTTCAKYLEFAFKEGGFVEKDEDVMKFFKTGQGSITIYPEVEFDKKLYAVVMTSYTPRFKIEHIQKALKLKGVLDVEDLTSLKSGVRIIFKLSKGLSGNECNDIAYKIQDMFCTKLPANILITERDENGEDVSLRYSTVHDIINDWITWRISFEKRVVERLVTLEKDKLQKLNWLLWALRNKQLVYQGLETKNPELFLVKKGKITEEHAKYIYDQQIRRLSKLEESKLKEEASDRKNKIKSLSGDIKTTQAISNRISQQLKKDFESKGE